jgi:hypothetical protein
MPAQRSFTDEQNERMRALVNALVRRFGNQRKVADALRISQPALSAFVLGKYGVGPAVARRIADLSGVSEKVMLGDDAPAEVESDEFPNRLPVVAFARQAGYRDTVLDRLLAARPRSDRDLPTAEWTRLLVMLASLDDAPFDLTAPLPKKRR